MGRRLRWPDRASFLKTLRSLSSRGVPVTIKNASFPSTSSAGHAACRLYGSWARAKAAAGVVGPIRLTRQIVKQRLLDLIVSGNLNKKSTGTVMQAANRYWRHPSRAKRGETGWARLCRLVHAPTRFTQSVELSQDEVFSGLRRFHREGVLSQNELKELAGYIREARSALVASFALRKQDLAELVAQIRQEAMRLQADTADTKFVVDAAPGLSTRCQQFVRTVESLSVYEDVRASAKEIVEAATGMLGELRK